MMKIDVKCIQPCEAKGPKLITPGRNDEGISVLTRCTACEVVPQNKSGSSKSQNVYFYVEMLMRDIYSKIFWE